MARGFTKHDLRLAFASGISFQKVNPNVPGKQIDKGFDEYYSFLQWVREKEGAMQFTQDEENVILALSIITPN